MAQNKNKACFCPKDMKKILLSCTISLPMSAVIWIGNISHWLPYLNTWSPAGGTLWESCELLGGRASLKQVAHWGGPWGIRVQPCLLITPCSLNIDACDQPAFCSFHYAVLAAAGSSLQLWGISLWNCGTKRAFLSSVAIVNKVYCSNKKVAERHISRADECGGD